MAKKQTEGTKTDRKIKNACLLAFLFSIVLVLLYFRFFHYGFSNDSNSWSNFGDYFNGVLSPILTAVNIYVFIRLTSTISKIEDNRANRALEQEKERSEKELNQAKEQFEKELEQTKTQFEKQLEHERSLLYLQFRKQELYNFCQNINDALSFYPKEEKIRKLENASSYLDTFVSSGLRLFMIEDKGVTERKIRRLKIDIDALSYNYIDNKPFDEKIFNNIMDARDSITKTLQEKTFYNNKI